MIWSRQFFFCLSAVVVGFAACGQNSNPPAVFAPTISATNLLPPMPQSVSPVNFFRQLLAMSPAERTASLTNRPPEARARILAKVREYQALGPDERELRLRATELRWWLTPLLRLTVAERAPRLVAVPDSLRELVNARLAQWDLLPPPMQQEFLASDQALHYFAHVETTNQPGVAREQKNNADQFSQFFELTPEEKRQTLNTLSDAERLAMEKTLQSFSQLPTQQRFQCIRNYAKFAGMSAVERADFLKNAESWAKMSPKERQTWRDLVQHIPQWPPMPPPGVPPSLMPHPVPKISRPSVATNSQ